MKGIKHLSIFAFLLLIAFALKALAQTPKIVWKNLQGQYEKVEDIKPIIVNEGAKPLFILPSAYLASIFRFNERTNKWDRVERQICEYAAFRITPIKLSPRKKISVDFDTFMLTSLKPSQFMPRLEQLTSHKGRYKLKLYYVLNKSEINFESDSPEFEIIESNYAIFTRY